MNIGGKKNPLTCILKQQSTASFSRIPSVRKQRDGDTVETVKSERPSAGSRNYTVILMSMSVFKWRLYVSGGHPGTVL